MGSADASRPVDIEVAQPGPLSTDSAATIELPQPSTLGAAQVGSGFPRAAEGAMSQLIAIDRAAIESVSVVTAQDVITAWAADGGPTARDWSGVVAVRTLLEGAGLPANGASALTVQLEPAMGKIVESGSDSTTVCVDFILTASVQGAQSDRIAVADCQHMAWQTDRWMIATGPEAEPMPSLWPGTQESINAGYQWLEVLP
ncbi:MAG: hypothetical protein ABIR39_18895 [Nocardioides sp.]|uniref:hypothetical protein n=1 Tax=Nocardioides sp. TaxID=35761 RepID=UPI0032657F53